jgi:integrase
MIAANTVSEIRASAVEALKLNNIIDFTTHQVIDPVKIKIKRSDSTLTSDGRPKPRAADPIRNPEHIKMFKEHFLSKGKYRDYMLFTLGCNTGRRASDLLKLKISDVYNPDGSIKTRFTIIEKKTRKTSVVYLNKVSRDAISLYLDTLLYKDPNQYLFYSQKPDEDGNHRIKVRSAYRILKDAASELKIHDEILHIGTHSLRKTNGYSIYKNSVDKSVALVNLQQWFNHRDMRTTRTYICLTDEDLMSMVEQNQI